MLPKMNFLIITYHELFENDQTNYGKYAISVKEFDRQMRYLKNNNYNSINVQTMLSSDIRTNKGKLIAISFDDGHYSSYRHAFPILQKYDFSGIFFITIDFIGKAGYVSWHDLSEMKCNGMAIESHSMTHPIMPDLNKSDLKSELKNSKFYLEKYLNCNVKLISIPGGFFSTDLVEMAKRENYKGICTSAPGSNKTNKNRFQVFNRFMITKNTSFDTFIKIVNKDPELIKQLRIMYKFKLILKSLLGNKLYYRIWSDFFK
jgi:peptidoglycan/xylan/chitin deacetylase (PgdA/CDA1 family)